MAVPELPEVEAVCRRIRAAITGQRIARAVAEALFRARVDLSLFRLPVEVATAGHFPG